MKRFVTAVLSALALVVGMFVVPASPADANPTPAVATTVVATRVVASSCNKNVGWSMRPGGMSAAELALYPHVTIPKKGKVRIGGKTVKAGMWIRTNYQTCAGVVWQPKQLKAGMVLVNMGGKTRISTCVNDIKFVKITKKAKKKAKKFKVIQAPAAPISVVVAPVITNENNNTNNNNITVVVQPPAPPVVIVVPPVILPTPTPTPTPTPIPDNPPQVNIMGSPAHIYVNGNDAVWVEAYDPDGDVVSVKIVGSGAGWVAGQIPVDIRWDGTPCPTGKSCYRATAWAGSTPGTMTVTATATANDKSAEPAVVSLPVLADEF